MKSQKSTILSDKKIKKKLLKRAVDGHQSQLLLIEFEHKKYLPIKINVADSWYDIKYSIRI